MVILLKIAHINNIITKYKNWSEYEEKTKKR